jgi:hypothetical protein
MHHVLVSPLLEEKAINLNDCRLSSTRRINKVKMHFNLLVKEAPQLKL